MFLQQLREQRATPEYRDDPARRVFYNILPESRSHEGYWLAHSYWDDFWALAGWRAGAEIARILDDSESVDWMQRQYDILKSGVYDSITLAMQQHGVDYVPGCAEKGDYDPTSTAAGIVYCGEKDNMPQPATTRTFDLFYQDLSKRFAPGAEFVFTPYEIRTVLAYLYLGQAERALRLLDFMLACRRPAGWRHLAEVVHSQPRFPCYIGDMPHTWVGADLINSIRGLFVYEEDGGLVIGAGIKPEWLDGAGVRVLDLPTRYGPISFTMQRAAQEVTIEVTGDCAPPAGFHLRLPPDAAEARALQLNGAPVASTHHTLMFPSLPVTVRAAP